MTPSIYLEAFCIAIGHINLTGKKLKLNMLYAYIIYVPWVFQQMCFMHVEIIVTSLVRELTIDLV